MEFEKTYALDKNNEKKGIKEIIPTLIFLIMGLILTFAFDERISPVGVWFIGIATGIAITTYVDLKHLLRKKLLP